MWLKSHLMYEDLDRLSISLIPIIGTYYSFIHLSKRIEAYLKAHLATDWERIKSIIDDYKAGRITKKELVTRGIKGLGKRFVSAFLSRAIFA